MQEMLEGGGCTTAGGRCQGAQLALQESPASAQRRNGMQARTCMADISSGSGKLQRAWGPRMARAAASYALAASSAVSNVPSQLQDKHTKHNNRRTQTHSAERHSTNQARAVLGCCESVRAS